MRGAPCAALRIPMSLLCFDRRLDPPARRSRRRVRMKGRENRDDAAAARRDLVVKHADHQDRAALDAIAFAADGNVEDAGTARRACGSPRTRGPRSRSPSSPTRRRSRSTSTPTPRARSRGRRHAVARGARALRMDRAPPVAGRGDQGCSRARARAALRRGRRRDRGHVARVCCARSTTSTHESDGLAGASARCATVSTSSCSTGAIPGCDGAEIVRSLRAAHITTPVLMLTALGARCPTGWRPGCRRERLPAQALRLRRTARAAPRTPSRLPGGGTSARGVRLDLPPRHRRRITARAGARVALTATENAVLDMLSRSPITSSRARRSRAPCSVRPMR